MPAADCEGRPAARRIAALMVPFCLATTSCALVPGDTPRPPGREDGEHMVWSEARSPDRSDSELLGIPKANPRWWLHNSDTPVEPWWRPDAPEEERLRSWRLRNPLHNFTHYIIGVADRDFVRYGLEAGKEWNREGPLNLALLRCGPAIYLPFVSWRGALIEWYLGWRSGGNFGVALRRSKAGWRLGADPGS